MSEETNFVWLVVANQVVDIVSHFDVIVLQGKHCKSPEGSCQLPSLPADKMIKSFICNNRASFIGKSTLAAIDHHSTDMVCIQINEERRDAPLAENMLKHQIILLY